MKKLLGTTLAVALLVPGPASAEILKNLKVSGALDVQATSARNITDFSTRQAGTGAVPANNDRIGATLTRVLVDASWDLLDDVHATVTLRKNDRPWGQAAGGLGQGAGGAQTVTAAGGVLGNTYVQRSAVTIDKLFGNADVTVGKQYYGDPGDLVIYAGPIEGSYGLSVTAIDALRVDWTNDWMAFSGLAGTTAGGALASGTGNTHVRGMDVLWKNLPVKVHTFVWNQLTQATGALGAGPAYGAANPNGKNDNLYIYGLKLRGEAMGGWMGLDVAANAGENRSSAAQTVAVACNTAGCNALSANYSGKAFLFDAGYNAELGSLGALTPWLNFGYGTGRSSNVEARNEGFTSIASDYRPGIINRRFDGNVQRIGSATAGTPVNGGAFQTNGLNNRVVYGLGVNMTPAAWEKLTVGGQFWSYNLQRVTHTNTLTAAGAQNGAKHLGTEFGLTADWKHSENVKMGAGWAMYMPGGAIKQYHANTATAGTGNSPASMVFGDLSVKF